MCKPLRGRELNCAIVTTSASETSEIGLWTSGCKPVRQALARIEQEVVLTIVERTVFNDRALSAIDTTNAQSQVFNDFVLETGSRFIHGLRLEVWINWRMGPTQITNVCCNG